MGNDVVFQFVLQYVKCRGRRWRTGGKQCVVVDVRVVVGGEKEAIC